MKLIEKRDLSDIVYLVPLGDLHLGSKNSKFALFKKEVEWVSVHKSAYIFLMGDLLDTALTNSVSSTFDQTLTLGSAQQSIREVLEPVKNRVLGAITGNHEARLEKTAGFNPLQSLCAFMDIPYAGYSAVLRFRIGKYKRKDGRISPAQEYVFYAHHSTGGGRTAGGKINRAAKLMDIFEGADSYIIGHNHAKISASPIRFYLSKSGNGKAAIKKREIKLIDAGSFLDWDDSYAEQKMLAPMSLGAPHIAMFATMKKKKIKVEFE